MTDTTAKEAAPNTPATYELGANEIAIIFSEQEGGLNARVVNSLEADRPTLLVPLVRGIFDALNEQGGADTLIQKGMASINAGQTVQ